MGRTDIRIDLIQLWSKNFRNLEQNIQMQRTYLIVDQAPLLEEGMDAHDSADIASKVASACGDSEILGWIKTVRVNHKIAIVLINSLSFTPIAVVEELWYALALNIMDRIHVKPGAVAREDNRLGLRN